MAVQCLYTYRIEISYINSSDNKEYPILANSIQYINVLHNYDTDLFPWIMLMIKLDADIYNKMIYDQGKGRINLAISKINRNATSSAYIDYIKDQFMFIMPEDPNPVEMFDGAVSGKGQAYKKTPIGLFKQELIQYNQKQFNGVYKNTTMTSLVLDATAHMKMLIEPFKFNTTIDMVSVPQISSVAQYISYLNSKYNFYGDQYMFFIDFDKTYLKSSSGRYIDAKDGQHPFIAFDIRDMTNYRTNAGGMYIDDNQKAYIMFVDPTYTSLSTDRATPEISSTISVINPSGEEISVNVDTSSVIGLDPNLDSKKYIFSKTDDNAATYIANSLQSNSINLIISKSEIDASIITPNKEYLITNYQGHSQYTGRYYLCYKQEVFYNAGVDFIYTTNIGMRMVVHY